ncbi:PIB2 Glutamine sensor PIB2 [Candida maltosa Xu316]|uniref:FYVE-type domain-containing protein n=1 Tax=Candida maltosa (strain Xu316) TaxID=1245528 RepID=M3K582_CANMX|nr:hypothetical protein G210_4521 [Candida maltosa Xu316]
MTDTKVLSQIKPQSDITPKHHTSKSKPRTAPLTPSALLHNTEEYNSSESSSHYRTKGSSTTSTTPITTANTSPVKEALPAFSFSKKAVYKNNSLASDLTSSIHRYDGSNYRSISTGGNGVNSRNPSDTAVIPYDYDEQIRFPRVNNFYTYNSKKTSFSSQEEKPQTKKVPSSESIIQEHEESSEHYQPALFDLNQPMRRYSVPLDLHESPDEQLLQEYTENNPIYRQQIREESHSDFSEESSSQHSKESEPPIPRNKYRPCNQSLKEMPSNKNIKQLYQLKKPLLTPAVLRPAYTNEEQNPTPPVIPSTSLYTIIKPKDNKPMPSCNVEPTHDHWKPDNATSNCMWCVKPFHNPIVSMIYESSKRHHCRFCGLIYCSNCLTNEKILIDNEARFVIPIISRKCPIPEFKDFKVCKKCAIIYDNLFKEVNGSSVTSKFVLIKNPFTDNLKSGNFEFNEPSFNRENSTTDKRSSIIDVPNDWIWSSF